MLLVTNLGAWQSKLDLTWCHLKQKITQILRDISQKTVLPTYSDTHAHLICVTFMFICPFSSRRDQTWYLVIICFCLLSTRDSSTVAGTWWWWWKFSLPFIFRFMQRLLLFFKVIKAQGRWFQELLIVNNIKSIHFIPLADDTNALQCFS